MWTRWLMGIGVAGVIAACAAGGNDAETGASAAASGSGGGTETDPNCSDGIKNGVETDVDCGGSCQQPCGDGQGCIDADDCLSQMCVNAACQPAACDDGVKNGNETDVDCGGGCPGCAVCLPCTQDSDCEPGLCQEGLCAPTIHVISATYAANCSAATPVPTIVMACEKKQKCDYLFNYTVDIGFDPAYGCYKDLKVDYECTGGTTVKTFYEACAPCDPQNTPTMITLELECQPCLGLGKPPA